MVRNFIYTMSPVILACCAQAMAVLLLLVFRSELPEELSGWTIFAIVNSIPLLTGIYVAVKEKGWKGRILVLLFSIAGTVAVMVFYGLVGVAISLFAFNR